MALWLCSLIVNYHVTNYHTELLPNTFPWYQLSRSSVKLQSRYHLGLTFHLKAQLGKDLLPGWQDCWLLAERHPQFLADWWLEAALIHGPGMASCFIKASKETSHFPKWTLQSYIMSLCHFCHSVLVKNNAQVLPVLKTGIIHGMSIRRVRSWGMGHFRVFLSIASRINI
jgi:hypothetical protein